MPELAGARVLIVEDEGMVAILLEDMLEDLGCVVAASVATVARAEEVVRSTPVDVALLDVNLAGETTADFARALTQHPIPIVFSTGYGSNGVPTDLRNWPVLAKPFEPGDLRQAIESVLKVAD
jgi:CheY-like chemotaxis protein